MDSDKDNASSTSSHSEKEAKEKCLHLGMRQASAYTPTIPQNGAIDEPPLALKKGANASKSVGMFNSPFATKKASGQDGATNGNTTTKAVKFQIDAKMMKGSQNIQMNAISGTPSSNGEHILMPGSPSKHKDEKDDPDVKHCKKKLSLSLLR
jgi:hypothetical protein